MPIAKYFKLYTDDSDYFWAANYEDLKAQYFLYYGFSYREDYGDDNIEERFDEVDLDTKFTMWYEKYPDKLPSDSTVKLDDDDYPEGPYEVVATVFEWRKISKVGFFTSRNN